MISTAEAFDDEMTERIARCRAERPAHWATIEEPIDLAAAVALVPGDACLLIDCITVWTGNLFHHCGDTAPAAVREAAEQLGDVLAAPTAPSVVVTNEVGLGLVPDNTPSAISPACRSAATTTSTSAPRSGGCGHGASDRHAWSLLAGLRPAEGAIALVVAHSVARGGSVWSMIGARGAGAGLGTQAVLAVRRSDVVLASIATAGVAVALLAQWGLLVVGLAGGAAVLFSRWGTARIDGLSGDVLGGAEQIAETVVLLTIVVIVGRGVMVPWW